MRICSWNMADKVDGQGQFVLDERAIVTFTLDRVSSITCTDFDMVPGIILDLDITRAEELFRIEWSASYGVQGCVDARQVRITLNPVD